MYFKDVTERSLKLCLRNNYFKIQFKVKHNQSTAQYLLCIYLRLRGFSIVLRNALLNIT